MIDNGYTYMDGYGHELDKGDRVVLGDHEENPIGTVDFTDWDGDADDWGRTIVIPPSAIVTFADGSEETLSCHNGHPDDTIVFEDLRKVA